MAQNNSSNQDYTRNADGFTISGGTTPRSLTVTGGSMTATGGSATTFNFPTNANYNKLVGMDGNNTALIPNYVGSYTTVITAAGTTTLTAASTRDYVFTGSTTQTVVLPAANTLALGQTFHIRNDSTGSITIQDGTTPTPVTRFVVAGGLDIVLMCTNVSSATGTWIGEIVGSAGIVPSEQIIIVDVARALTNGIAVQKLFGATTSIANGGPGTTNGALTVDPLSVYFFECMIYLTGMSATAGNIGFSLVGAGTATFTWANFMSHGLDATTQTTSAALGGMFAQTTNSATSIVGITGSQTGTAAHAFIKGSFKTNAAGTIIPSINLITASAATVGVGTYFRCSKVGFAGVVSIGNWT